MNPDLFFYIQRWDLQHCRQHVVAVFQQILPTLKSYYQNDPIIYIDIGANVGKMYDLFYEESGLDIEHSYLFEASSVLYEYMLTKYKENNKCTIYNDIILDTKTNINFDDDYFLSEILNKPEYINFGLSKINKYKNNNLRETKQISTFLVNNNYIFNKKTFIKIDTENSDIIILKDLLSVINNFKYKPVIEFEINYSCDGYPIESAQEILNIYANKYRYNHINLSQTTGDGVLIPEISC